MTQFRIGDRAHYPGQGLGTITRKIEVEASTCFYLDMDRGSGIGVPVEEAATLLWPLPSVEEAERRLRALMMPTAPTTASWAERYADFEHAIVEGTMDDYIRVLRENLARGVPSSFGERRMMLLLEDNVIAPIAEALGRDPSALLEEVAAFQRDHAL